MTKPEIYIKGYKTGWHDAAKLITDRLKEDDVFNSHIEFALEKIKELLYSDNQQLQKQNSNPTDIKLNFKGRR